MSVSAIVRQYISPTGVSVEADALARLEAMLRTAGGSGSGNFGHAGRPGEVGGSGPGDGAAVSSYSMPPASDDPAPGGRHYYHATPVSRLQSIRKSGLVAPKNSQNAISLSPHLDSAHYWGGAVGDRGEQMALLRVQRQFVRLEPHPKEHEYSAQDPTAEDATYSTVKPERLQVYVDGQWQDLLF